VHVTVRIEKVVEGRLISTLRESTLLRLRGRMMRLRSRPLAYTLYIRWGWRLQDASRRCGAVCWWGRR
jgi:hypothetical protein